jgi:hypothetical protein
MKVKLVLKHAISDRPLVISWFVLLMATLIIAVVFATQIRASELNIPIRYTAFGVGITHIYNDTWYYLLNFIFFIVGSLVVHTFIALKLFLQKGTVFARLFIHLSIILLLVEYFLISSVLGIASFSQ